MGELVNLDFNDDFNSLFERVVGKSRHLEMTDFMVSKFTVYMYLKFIKQIIYK